MTRLNPVILLQQYHKLWPADGTRTPPPAQRLIQPEYDFDWSTFGAVELELHIQGINGAPTGWSLHPRLEIGITSSSGYQFTNNFWRTLSRDEAKALSPRGAQEWLPDLTQADIPNTIPAGTPPFIYRFWIAQPHAAMRINLGYYGQGSTNADRLIMTGGTNPNIQAALVAYPKG